MNFSTGKGDDYKQILKNMKEEKNRKFNMEMQAILTRYKKEH